MVSYASDGNTSLVSSTTLSGWAGPNPLNVIKILKPGLYSIEGMLAYSSTLTPAISCGILAIAKQGGGTLAAGAVRGTIAANQPIFYNSYCIFAKSFRSARRHRRVSLRRHVQRRGQQGDVVEPGVFHIKRQELVVGQVPGDDAALARWNSAWGVVGKGAFNLANGAAIPASATTVLGSCSTTLVAGRRYLLKLWLNGWSAASPMTGYFNVNASGNAGDVSGGPWKWTGGNYDSLGLEWPIVPGTTATSNGALLAGPQTFRVSFTNQSAVAGGHYNDQGFFDIFDVGPVTPAAVSPPAGATPVVAAGNAIGIVAVGSFVGSAAYSLAAGTDVRFTNYLPFTSVVGRRYRMHCQLRVVGATTGNGINFLPHGPGVGGASWDLWHTTANYGYANIEVLFDGNGTSGNYWWGGSSSTAVTLYLDTMSSFYIEDVGPNSVPALPIPETPPAWQPATLLNGWYVTAGDQPAQYRKVGDMVYVRGYLKHANVTAQGNVIILPPGFRPPYYIPANVAYYFGSPPSNYAITSLALQTDGRVGYDGAKTTIGFMTFDFSFSVTP